MSDTVTSWWNNVSLRSKITGVTVLVLAFSILFAGVGTVVLLSPILVRQAEDRLVTTAQTQTQQLVSFAADGSEAQLSSRQDYFLALYENGMLLDANWKQQPTSALPAIPDSINAIERELLSQRPHMIKSANGKNEFRIIAVTPPETSRLRADYTLVVAVSMRDTENVIATYLTVFFGLGIAVIMLGAALTRLLVTTTLMPLREVERASAAIADGDFGKRLPNTAPGTEIGHLNRSLNTMLDHIDTAIADRNRSIEQMRRFVGDASHELRTPLVTVRGYAELYRMGAIQNPDDIAQAMERIEKEAIRMGLLVEDLLELARLDETKPLSMGPVDLLVIAQDAVMDARASSPQRTIRVVLDEQALALDDGSAPDSSAPVVTLTPPEPEAPPARGRSASTATGTIERFSRLRGRKPRKDAPAVPESLLRPDVAVETAVPAIVLGEENKIRQVVTNLMGNAKRFTPEDSPIEIGVSASSRTGHATIAIIDHGEGVPPQIREKIFQRFWRADTSRARETGGSGLGLAIVASIVQAHHGHVEVTETPGGGATFRVTLDLLRDPSANTHRDA